LLSVSTPDHQGQVTTNQDFVGSEEISTTFADLWVIESCILTDVAFAHIIYNLI